MAFFSGALDYLREAVEPKKIQEEREEVLEWLDGLKVTAIAAMVISAVGLFLSAALALTGPIGFIISIPCALLCAAVFPLAHDLFYCSSNLSTELSKPGSTKPKLLESEDVFAKRLLKLALKDNWLITPDLLDQKV